MPDTRRDLSRRIDQTNLLHSVVTAEREVGPEEICRVIEVMFIEAGDLAGVIDFEAIALSVPNFDQKLSVESRKLKSKIGFNCINFRIGKLLHSLEAGVNPAWCQVRQSYPISSKPRQSICSFPTLLGIA